MVMMMMMIGQNKIKTNDNDKQWNTGRIKITLASRAIKSERWGGDGIIHKVMLECSLVVDISKCDMKKKME